VHHENRRMLIFRDEGSRILGYGVICKASDFTWTGTPKSFGRRWTVDAKLPTMPADVIRVCRSEDEAGGSRTDAWQIAKIFLVQICTAKVTH
jgi:hypothetical protein